MQCDFTYYMPTRIVFGAGKLKELASIKPLPGKKALVIIGSAGAMKKYGYLEKVTGYLKQNGVAAEVYDGVCANPVLENVEEGAEAAKRNGCDFVIGLGGGSSLDAAKSIAVMATNPGGYWDYMMGGTGKRKTPRTSPCRF